MSDLPIQDGEHPEGALFNLDEFAAIGDLPEAAIPPRELVDAAITTDSSNTLPEEVRSAANALHGLITERIDAAKQRRANSLVPLADDRRVTFDITGHKLDRDFDFLRNATERRNRRLTLEKLPDRNYLTKSEMDSARRAGVHAIEGQRDTVMKRRDEAATISEDLNGFSDKVKAPGKRPTRQEYATVAGHLQSIFAAIAEEPNSIYELEELWGVFTDSLVQGNPNLTDANWAIWADIASEWFNQVRIDHNQLVNDTGRYITRQGLRPQVTERRLRLAREKQDRLDRAA